MLKAWNIFTTTITLIVISVICGIGFVELFAREGAVIQRIGDINNFTGVVQFEKTVSYNIDVEKLESCAGTMVIVFRSAPDANNEISTVTMERPTFPDTTITGIPRPVRVGVVLPESVYPGKWTYIGGIRSQCPTRKRFDELARFDFEVIK